ncbi:hypothetical protein [Actinosynnema sp. ALI-1.44]|nr:hypothetical protein [Actinosynnema sp. ALI-1.44]
MIEAVADDEVEEDRPGRRRGRADQANDMGGEFVATALEAWGFSTRE